MILELFGMTEDVGSNLIKVLMDKDHLQLVALIVCNSGSPIEMRLWGSLASDSLG